ncbi:primase-like DNA-binding domain-containing protein [Escherichia coli]|uniref:DNA primase family protein n=1 Tax=Escherichia coli TaxID=562 RepID=UPI0007A5FB21|nr:primase-like DNA-binding domain-containing protein [Escherichia coli]MCK3121217.1 primase-like DNA-binding domain-containing protein [Escherichia coli]
MKNAPNLKYQPKDKFTEVIIFAGTDAYSHAQHWIESEGRKHGDNVPPVYLGPKQLADLVNIRIVDDERRFARVYLAGEIEPIQINAIAEKLALAGVQDAKLYKGITDREPENWRDYLQRIREQAERGDILSVRTEKKHKISLSRMADNERASLLAECFEEIAVHPGNNFAYAYCSGVWKKISDMELSRKMVSIYEKNKTNFSKRAISNAVDALKISVPVMREQRDTIIPFENGVYDITSGRFLPHSPEHWITSHNGIYYTPPALGENIHDHAPHFHRWLSHAAGYDSSKMKRICAALFMVLANRYDWQLFIEATGEGGSGKSMFTQIARMLAGEQNTAGSDMKALDDAGGREQLVGKSLIILPDQPKYFGEGNGIKAITGGDPLQINPKYEKRYTTVLRSVVLITNNKPMVFTERAGGISRRRVIFQFNNPIAEENKDTCLPKKIAAEIPVIVRRLLVNFSDPEKARTLLLEQRDGEEAMEVKRHTDPLYAFCNHIVELGEAVGMFMGNLNIYPRAPRIYLYHAYLAYMDAYGFDKPLNLTNFGKDFPKVMKEYGAEYKKAKTNVGMRYNMELADSANEWLPAVPKIHEK